MNSRDYNRSGILGANASIHNKRASSPLSPDMARRMPYRRISEQISRKAAWHLASEGSFVWSLSDSEASFRPAIIADLSERCSILAEPVGLLGIRVIEQIVEEIHIEGYEPVPVYAGMIR